MADGVRNVTVGRSTSDVLIGRAEADIKTDLVVTPNAIGHYESLYG